MHTYIVKTLKTDLKKTHAIGCRFHPHFLTKKTTTQSAFVAIESRQFRWWPMRFQLLIGGFYADAYFDGIIISIKNNGWSCEVIILFMSVCGSKYAYVWSCQVEASQVGCPEVLHGSQDLFHMHWMLVPVHFAYEQIDAFKQPAGAYLPRIHCG